MAESLHIELFGGLRLHCGETAGSEFRTRKTALLLAYLACYPGRKHAREVVAELLWPGNTPEANSGNLRTALWALRRQLAGAGHGGALIATKTHIGLEATAVTTDIAQFEAALQAAARAEDPATETRHLGEATALYRPLLPGFYEDWVLAEQQRLEELYYRALNRLVGRLQEMNDLPGAIGQLQQGITLDTVREELYQELIRLQLAAGQPAAAVQTYRTLERVLRDRLDTLPNASSRQLLTAIAEVAKATSRASFIGRQGEIAGVLELLQHDELRLLTLTGQGGTGKTRFAMQVAAEMLDAFADGVHFVSLAALTDAALVAPAIAHVLGVKGSAGQGMWECLWQHLCAKHMLLVLDNFEQVAAAAGEVAALLEACPHLKVLVTSRVALGLRNEREYVVAGLAAPPRGSLPSLPALTQFAAVELFIREAQLSAPDFVINNETAPAVAEICARLEGLPLAIELTAARLDRYAPRAILAALESALVPPPPAAPAPVGAPLRHQTLRQIIEWSYDLLTAEEQRLCLQFSLHVGGSTELALRAILGPRPTGGPTVDDLLQTLVAKKLVQHEASGLGGMRYRMHEAIRAFCIVQLKANGHFEAEQRRFAEHYINWLRHHDTHEILERKAISLEFYKIANVEYENLAAGLRWVEAHAPDLLVISHSSFALFLKSQGRYEESKRLYERSLWCMDDGVQRAEICCLLGEIYNLTSELGPAEANLREALALFTRHGHKTGIAASLGGLASTAAQRGAIEAALALLEEARAPVYEEGSAEEIAAHFLSVGIHYLSLADFHQARRHLEEGLRRQQETAPPGQWVCATVNLAFIARHEGDLPRAATLLAEARAMQELKPDRANLSSVLWGQAMVARDRGDWDLAHVHFMQSLTIDEQTDAPRRIVNNLHGLAGLALATGHATEGTVLLAAGVALLDAIGGIMYPLDCLEYDRYLAAAKAALDDASFAAAWSRGSSLSKQTAVEYARSLGLTEK